jgi:hypothetical protein
MVFFLHLKMNADQASSFHPWLLKAGRSIGLAPTGMTSDSDDGDSGHPEIQTYSFVCQAAAALKPEQLIRLFTECQRINAVVLGIVYQESPEEEDDDDCDGMADWRELQDSAPRIVSNNTGRTAGPRLQLINGGRSDDPDEQ